MGNFFKTAQIVHTHAIDNFYRISTDFSAEYYRAHNAKAGKTLYDCMGSRALESYENNKKIHNSLALCRESLPDSNESFTEIIVNGDVVSKNLDLKISIGFKNNISVLDEMIRDSVAANTHVFDNNVRSNLQKEFLKNNLLDFYLLIESPKTTSISYMAKPINIKKFDTSTDYDLDVFSEEGKIVYKHKLVTIIQLTDFTLKKTTENIYNIPIVIPEEYIDEEEMFKILIQSPVFDEYMVNIIRTCIDSYGLSREKCAIIQYEFYKCVSRYVYSIGKFQTSKDFIHFCLKSDRINDFLEACLDMSLKRYFPGEYGSYGLKSKYYARSRAYKDDLYGF